MIDDACCNVYLINQVDTVFGTLLYCIVMIVWLHHYE